MTDDKKESLKLLNCYVCDEPDARVTRILRNKSVMFAGSPGPPPKCSRCESEDRNTGVNDLCVRLRQRDEALAAMTKERDAARVVSVEYQDMANTLTLEVDDLTRQLANVREALADNNRWLKSKAIKEVIAMCADD